MKKVLRMVPHDPRRLETARRLVRQAIDELIQSGYAPEMSNQINRLYRLEDELWQYATATGRRARG